MSDHVRLSYWLRGFTAENMLGSLDAALRCLPVSRLAPALSLKIYAIEFSEPAMVERVFEDPVDLEEVIAAAGEFLNPDCAYQVDAFWDLWQWKGDWALRPAAVSLVCFGPLFESEWGEQVQIDFGPDGSFLPAEDMPEGGLAIRSNIRSLLHLAGDLDQALAVEKRMLWSDSGENLAERLVERTSAGP